MVNKSTGKTMGCHSTKASAGKQLAALAVNVTSKESAEPAMTDPDDETQTGVVVVALPAADDACQGIGPEQKHATLLFFGDVEGGENPNDLLTADVEASLRSVLAIAAATYGPFTEQVTAVEPLGDGGAVVWMLQGTELPDLRADLLDTDSELVGPLENVAQFPTYTPHVTVGYEPGSDLTQGDSPTHLADGDVEAAEAVTEITFDRLALWWAGNQHEYPLTGTTDPGRGTAANETQRPGGPMSKALHESTRLVEVDGGSNTGTRRRIQIITPGWGTSGYYSADVLERAAKNRVIPKGTHMFLNHASESEARDRPERDVEKIAAVLVEDAIWDGKRLAGDADIMGPHAELIEALAPYIGVSISGSATDITLGEAEGRKGPIIEDLARVDSVDFVTHAGRGGMILLESARPSLVTALAIGHGVAEATANETYEALSNALREQFPGDKVWIWVRDYDDSTVWYQYETPDDSGTYALDYSLSADGVVTFSGDPVEVRAETNYVPVPPSSTKTKEAAPADAGAGDTTTPEDAATGEPSPETQAAAGAPEQTANGDQPGTETTAPSNKETHVTDTNPGAGGSAPTQEATAPRNPREVMEAQLNEQGRQIRLLRAGQQAQAVVARVLGDGWVAESTKARLGRELTTEASLPLTEAGELDEAALQARAVERLHEAETEAAETMSAFGFGKVRGLGGAALTESSGSESVNPYADSINESMKKIGLSESAAEIATKGR